VRIFTGGFVPEGADSILLQEDAEAADGAVVVKESVTAGRWVRKRGLDFAEGEALLAQGRRLTARDIGLAAASNNPWLAVHRRPRVGILATGDEIALPGDPIPAGGIVSSNAHALAALIRAGGGEPIVLPIAPDDSKAIADIAASAHGYDLLVTTGGASVGEHDLIQKALGGEGFELGFWKIAMRPGKPLMFGRLGAQRVVGLPGNPVSALICTRIFVVPLMRALLGQPASLDALTSMRAGAPIEANGPRQHYMRATVRRGGDGVDVAVPARSQDSSLLSPLAEANAFIVRPPEAPAVPAGSPVEVLRLDF